MIMYFFLECVQPHACDMLDNIHGSVYVFVIFVLM